MSLEWSSEDGWSGDPHLVHVTPEADLICPVCQMHVTHMQPIIWEPPEITYTPCMPSVPRFDGWTLIPCTHEVSASDHVLWFNEEGIGKFRPKEKRA